MGIEDESAEQILDEDNGPLQDESVEQEQELPASRMGGCMGRGGGRVA